jgi:CheY-like chemotaxis protein
VADEKTPYSLVVDDDPIIRMDIVDILETAGFRTLEAVNVDDALNLLEMYAHDIRLLFSDVEMLGQHNGFHLARVCDQKWPHISIMVASGRMKPGPADLPDAAAFIGKPFSSELVYDRLQELLPDGEKPAPLAQRLKNIVQ